jgi:hypothetical protein
MYQSSWELWSHCIKRFAHLEKFVIQFTGPPLFVSMGLHMSYSLQTQVDRPSGIFGYFNKTEDCQFNSTSRDIFILLHSNT